MHFDIYQSVALGVLALSAGGFLNKRIPLLGRLCLPSAVTGGLLFSLITLTIYCIWGIKVEFDETVKNLCMTMFFTSVGFQADFTLLRKGGKALAIMVGLVSALIICQNLLGVGLAKAFGESALLGVAIGSIPMCGGHGTAGGFSAMLSQMGLASASSVTMAAATFGLVAGSLLGAPLASSLITKRKLSCPPAADDSDDGIRDAATSAAQIEVNPILEEKSIESVSKKAAAVFAIFVSMGLGTLMNKALSALGISFPTYFGSLLVAAIIRNATEIIPRCPKLPVRQISGVGGIALSIFLGIAMISLKLWELADLALPLVGILAGQILLMWIFARFIAMPLLGGDYNAAVLIGGLCGFGLGATPNAMANMEAVCTKHGYSTLPFVVVPLVGAIFVDIINVSVITVFLNLIG